MVSAYYDELAGHPDPARAVGWESRTAQLARYDFVAGLIRPGDRVLDLGAGLGDLGRHLAARGAVDYVGLEREPTLLARGRAMSPTVDLRAADFMADPWPEADVVVAIGVLVDGASLRQDAVRFGRLRRLIARMRTAHPRTAVLVALDQDLLERHPILSREPALGGLRRAEQPWLAPDAVLHPPVGERLHPLLELDLALVMAR